MFVIQVTRTPSRSKYFLSVLDINIFSLYTTGFSGLENYTLAKLPLLQFFSIYNTCDAKLCFFFLSTIQFQNSLKPLCNDSARFCLWLHRVDVRIQMLMVKDIILEEISSLRHQFSVQTFDTFDQLGVFMTPHQMW